MYSIENKVALVTGGAHGIGACIVREFLKEGAKHVAFLDVKEDSGKLLEDELITKYGENKAKFYKCDITIDEELFGAFDNVVKEHDVLDIVVNNAGIVIETLEMYKREIEINYIALVSSTLRASELMRVDHGGKGGTIINISSMGALTQRAAYAPIYFGSKSAVLQFSNCMGLQPYYNHTKVRVITVCFGPTNTMMQYDTFDKINAENVSKIYFENISNPDYMQRPEKAAQGVLESYKKGESGSNWVVCNNKVVDITERVRKAYAIMSEGFVWQKDLTVALTRQTVSSDIEEEVNDTQRDITSEANMKFQKQEIHQINAPETPERREAYRDWGKLTPTSCTVGTTDSLRKFKAFLNYMWSAVYWLSKFFVKCK